MNQNKKTVEILRSLISNNICQFIIGLFLVVLMTRVSDAIEFLSLQLFIKSVSYIIFFYLGTPFLIYWLAYVSAMKLTKVKLTVTILLVAMYSYIFWDSYFFYKDTLGRLFFS
ncbi:hypothetical protein [Xenococcus sp. PCC 7305]|uniref:hypothetical protein n=1 Tax=Xenococcus sp. PCC 7305 TaxID=102125 RepID=UPI0002F830E4|nr:hypothetical protein [Xenococcus sp. PCC 7305]